MGSDSLGRFKRSNGFVKRLVPRYYVPLTLKGKIVLLLHLHHGVKGLIPNVIKDKLRPLRKKMLRAGIQR